MLNVSDLPATAKQCELAAFLKWTAATIATVTYLVGLLAAGPLAGRTGAGSGHLEVSLGSLLALLSDAMLDPSVRDDGQDGGSRASGDTDPHVVPPLQVLVGVIGKGT